MIVQCNPQWFMQGDLVRQCWYGWSSASFKHSLLDLSRYWGDNSNFFWKVRFLGHLCKVLDATRFGRRGRLLGLLPHHCPIHHCHSSSEMKMSDQWLMPINDQHRNLFEMRRTNDNFKTTQNEWEEPGLAGSGGLLDQWTSHSSLEHWKTCAWIIARIKWTQFLLLYSNLLRLQVYIAFVINAINANARTKM